MSRFGVIRCTEGTLKGPKATVSMGSAYSTLNMSVFITEVSFFYFSLTVRKTFFLCWIIPVFLARNYRYLQMGNLKCFTGELTPNKGR